MSDTAEFAAGLLNPQHAVPALIKGQIERRYAVYRNNVTVSLIRALEANFSVVRKLLGEHYFAGFARDFAQRQPPQSPLMFQYGKAFPEALEADEDLANYPYLGDVARLEMIWRESYHAADADQLAGSALAAVDAEQLFNICFIAHPALRLMQSEFAIYSIFANNMPGSEDQTIDPSHSQSVIITRPLHDVEVREITPQQFAFFLALKNGETLGVALDHAAGLDTNFDLSAALTLLLQSGAFQTIQTGNEKTP